MEAEIKLENPIFYQWLKTNLIVSKVSAKGEGVKAVRKKFANTGQLV